MIPTSLPEYSSTREVQILKGGEVIQDWVIAEEPLEIILRTADRRESIVTTMRTPGADHLLALGYLWSEGITEDILSLQRPLSCGENNNQVEIEVKKWPKSLEGGNQRVGFQSSSCGVCGKVSIDELLSHSYQRVDAPERYWSPEDLDVLLERILEGQPLFHETGGSHGVWLFDENNRLVISFEDVGRHNALDKLMGWVALREPGGVSKMTLVLSSRLSYELVHKAAVLGAFVVISVGAPSSLAVELANKMKMTTIGFFRNKRFNLYTNRLALYRYDY